MENINENTFITDLIKVQTEIEKISKNESNPFFKSKYVPLPAILAQVKPVLNSHNFLLTQRLEIAYGSVASEAQQILITDLFHISGRTLSASALIKISDKDKTDPQKYGSAITYMRRYSLTALLGLEEVDDDGNKAAGNKNNNKTIVSKGLGQVADEDMKKIQEEENEKQFARIKDLIESCGSAIELQAVWENEQKTINKIKKYAGNLYDMLLQSKDSMKKSLGIE